jgi:UDP:flavonoid glycosyltransferase YjiC (YdhE family)
LARIAFAWELGGSIGHVLSCAGLARSLAARGHSIAFMLRERSALQMVPEAEGYEVFDAPRSPREAREVGVPVSYADILLGCGYRDANDVGALLAGWRSLLAQWKPDLVVADFAPTALLAARSLGIRRVTYGNGFFTPPRLSPLPPFRVDEPPDPARLAAADAAALVGANSALAQAGADPLARLADLFAVDEDFLCTYPELDHYGTRPVSGYWGPRLRTDLGNPMDFPAGAGKRVLVYVQRSLPQLDALADALAAGGHRVIAFIPGLDDERRARLSGRGRGVIDRPIRLDIALRQCELLVCHGGEIAGGALASGVPVLLFPTHYEQYLTARRLEQSGAGGWIPPSGNAASVQAGVQAMTTDPRYLAAARAFAQRYPAWSPQEQRRRIVARIEQLLAGAAASPILTRSP